MLRRLPWRTLASRLALAYLVLAQLLLGGVAMAQHAGLRLASGADVLCSGGASDPLGGAPHDALCCVLGCAASAPLPLPDGNAAAVPFPVPRLRAAPFVPAGPAGAPRSLSLAFDATGPPARA